jgi:hypothetical protein
MLRNNNVDSRKKKLLGRWKKITNTKCSEIYPDDLEFMDKDIYVGRKGQEAVKLSYWDTGAYQILTDDQVKISAANDAEVIYKFSISANTLTFMDKDRCEFRYQKTE